MKKILPEGWLFRTAAAVMAALLGNLLMAVLPWPEAVLVDYSDSMTSFMASGLRFLLMTLVVAPVFEEAIFRAGIYRLIRRVTNIPLAAIGSAIAFGIYHGNWIQGIYAFFMGLVFAWGYESSEDNRYRMVVLMHGAANGTVLLASLLIQLFTA